MKTVTINGKQYSGVQTQGMSDAAFVSMVVRNDMTTEKMNKLMLAIKTKLSC